MCLQYPHVVQVVHILNSRAGGLRVVESGATLMHHPLYSIATAASPQLQGQGTSIRCGRSSGPVASTVAIRVTKDLAAGSRAAAAAGSGLGTKVWGCALSDTSSTGHP